MTIVFLYQQQEEARNPQHFLYLLFYIELMIENMLLCSLLSEEEVLITYYEDGYLLSNYMTVVGIDPPNSAVICTDVFYNKMKLLFSNIIDVK
ncbi:MULTISPECIES: YolD-like family protein [Bacillus]|uniref:YolD-like family protein n=1 Tax=Bacillus TaxID=1386 RepID=UPI0030C7BBBC